jgi:hypothetical protein
MELAAFLNTLADVEVLEANPVDSSVFSASCCFVCRKSQDRFVFLKGTRDPSLLQLKLYANHVLEIEQVQFMFQSTAQAVLVRQESKELEYFGMELDRGCVQMRMWSQDMNVLAEWINTLEGPKRMASLEGCDAVCSWMESQDELVSSLPDKLSRALVNYHCTREVDSTDLDACPHIQTEDYHRLCLELQSEVDQLEIERKNIMETKLALRSLNLSTTLERLESLSKRIQLLKKARLTARYLSDIELSTM